MTGGGGHETPRLDLISSALEGSYVEAAAPTPVQDSLGLCPATISILHIEHGGYVLHQLLDRILTLREILSVEHSRLNSGVLPAGLFLPGVYHRRSESSSLQDHP